jgi:hypothetical protein
MLWTGVISRRTGKRDGVLENFRLAYEMLHTRDNCAWWSYVDRSGILHVTWLSSMNLLRHAYVILQVVPGSMELFVVLHCSCVIGVTNCVGRAIEGKQCDCF